MARKKIKEQIDGQLSLFSPEDYMEKVEAVVSTHVTRDNQTVFRDTEVDRDKLIKRMVEMDDFLKTLDKTRIRIIGLETATLYQSGISTNELYSLKSIPGSEYDWYDVVALTYASFGICFPAMLGKINPSYINEYNTAVANRC